MKTYFQKLFTGTKQEFVKQLESCLKKKQRQFIITANPETFMVGKKDEVLNRALLDPHTLVVADGIALVKTSKKFDVVCPKITGVDITYELFELANQFKKSLYLFGSTKEVIKKTVEKIKKDYPNIKVVGYCDGYVKDKDQVFDEMVTKKPDVVLVALGIPQQEKLIYQNLSRFQKGIFVGVGGTFDVFSGVKKRAPKFFQKWNLEWLYRIVTEPKRLKRFYQHNIKFVFRILFMKKG